MLTDSLIAVVLTPLLGIPNPPQEGNPMVPRKKPCGPSKGKKWGFREEIFREYWILLILYPTSRVHCKGNYGNLQYSGPMAVAESCSIQLSGQIYWGGLHPQCIIRPGKPGEYSGRARKADSCPHLIPSMRGAGVAALKSFCAPGVLCGDEHLSGSVTNKPNFNTKQLRLCQKY